MAEQTVMRTPGIGCKPPPPPPPSHPLDTNNMSRGDSRHLTHSDNASPWALKCEMIATAGVTKAHREGRAGGGLAPAVVTGLESAYYLSLLLQRYSSTDLSSTYHSSNYSLCSP
jgi:hypothetical protein